MFLYLFLSFYAYIVDLVFKTNAVILMWMARMLGDITSVFLSLCVCSLGSVGTGYGCRMWGGGGRGACGYVAIHVCVCVGMHALSWVE
jgi:hypothetical protein